MSTPEKDAAKDKGKRKQETPSHKMETRTRKKARETFDFVTGTAQRAESALNLLGEDYAGPSDEELKMIFRVYDRDNDGKIGSEEIADVLRSMGKRPLTKKIQKMLDECDPEKHGYIARDEFIKFMKNKASKKAEQMATAEKGEKDAEKSTEKKEEKKEKKEEKKEKKEEKKEKKEEKKKEEKKEKKEEKTTPKKGKSKEKKSDKASSSKAKASKEKAPLVRRSSSILGYYTSNAGTQGTAEAPLDKYNNPVGNEFDLGQDQAFGEFSILIGFFYNNFDATPLLDALKTKGFQVVSVKTETEFVAELETGKHSQAWIIPTISFSVGVPARNDFTNAVVKFHESGGGLFIWGDNEPYYAQSNVVLQRLFDVKFVGNDAGQKVLHLGDAKALQTFGNHLITSGINHLYEGHTICYLDKVPDKLVTLANSSHGHAVILYADNDKFAPHCGRVLLDCGFTKLWTQWDSAGTARYAKNAATWLVGVENRLAAAVPVTGPIVPKKNEEKALWEYKHGGWHKYDEDASKIVEEAYQDWLKNPYTDVRAVKSGSWQYSVDFRQMLQTNIQHEAHTQRDIRRKTDAK